MQQAPPSRPPERYGDDRPAWHRTLARVLTATLAVVGVAFVVWVAINSGSAPVRTTDVGFDLDHAPGEVTVDFEVTMDPGTAATCTLRALNAQYGVVGVAEVAVDASSGRTQRVTGTVLVSEPAVSAGVQGCVPR